MFWVGLVKAQTLILEFVTGMFTSDPYTTYQSLSRFPTKNGAKPAASRCAGLNETYHPAAKYTDLKGEKIYAGTYFK